MMGRCHYAIIGKGFWAVMPLFKEEPNNPCLSKATIFEMVRMAGKVMQLPNDMRFLTFIHGTNSCIRIVLNMGVGIWDLKTFLGNLLEPKTLDSAELPNGDMNILLQLLYLMPSFPFFHERTSCLYKS